MQALPSVARVVVKFREGRSIRQSAGRLTGMTTTEAAAFANVLRLSGVPANSGVRRLHARSEAELDQERIAAERESGRDLADLNLVLRYRPSWPARMQLSSPIGSMRSL